MAAEPDDFRDTVERWPRLSAQQRAAVVHRLVARSREGDPVTGEMEELLTLLRVTRKIGPGHQGAAAADRPARRPAVGAAPARVSCRASARMVGG